MRKSARISSVAFPSLEGVANSPLLSLSFRLLLILLFLFLLVVTNVVDPYNPPEQLGAIQIICRPGLPLNQPPATRACGGRREGQSAVLQTHGKDRAPLVFVGEEGKTFRFPSALVSDKIDIYNLSIPELF